MLQILSAVLGFAAPFLPELLKFYQRKQDNEHELAMMKMRLDHAAAEHTWRMEEINANADIAEMNTLRMPQQSFGVQLLDAGTKWANKAWLMPIFYLFSFLDFFSGMVRPTITYAAFCFYTWVKYAQIQVAAKTSGSLTMAALQVWSENDMAVIILVLSYWFGHRQAKMAFGGSASTSKRGA